MGLLGHILGGALQGAGAGIVQDAAQQREAALAAMRIKYQQNKDAQDIAVADARRKEDRADKVADMDTSYKQKAGLLAVGGAIQENRDAKQQTYAVELQKVRTQNDIALENIRSKNDITEGQSKFAQEKQLEALRAGTKVDKWEIGADGAMVGYRADGTTIRGKPGTHAPGSAPESTGGGRLTEGEQGSAYEDDRKAWRDGGSKGPEPKKSDYIGMTRADYSSRKRTPGTLSPRPSEKPKAEATISVDEYNAGLQAAIKARNQGRPGYAGLTDAQLRSKLEAIARANGQTLPSI